MKVRVRETLRAVRWDGSNEDEIIKTFELSAHKISIVGRELFIEDLIDPFPVTTMDVGDVLVEGVFGDLMVCGSQEFEHVYEVIE